MATAGRPVFHCSSSVTEVKSSFKPIFSSLRNHPASIAGWKKRSVIGRYLNSIFAAAMPDKTTVSYYYVPGVGWQTPSAGMPTDAAIPPGSAFFIQRKAPRPVFLWTIPAE